MLGNADFGVMANTGVEKALLKYIINGHGALLVIQRGTLTTPHKYQEFRYK